MKKLLFIFTLALLIIGCGKEDNPTVGNTNPINDPNAAVQTGEFNALSCTSISGTGIIKSGTTFTEKGIVLSRNSAPTISDLKAIDQSSGMTISATKTGLTPSTKYFYRAYILTSTGPVYGGEGSITTPACGSGGGNSIDTNFYINLTADGKNLNTRQMRNGQITNECMFWWGKGANGGTLINIVRNDYLFSYAAFSIQNTVGTHRLNTENDGSIQFYPMPISTSSMFCSFCNQTKTPKPNGGCDESPFTFGPASMTITKITPYVLPSSVMSPDSLRNCFIVEGNLAGTFYEAFPDKCVSSRQTSTSGEFRLIGWLQ